MKIAVVADPHFHDIHRHPGGEAFGPFAFRTFADTAASTRVFNESDHAMRAALDDIVARGISIVVIVGDLTDDGQAATVRNALAVLDSYREQYGLRFFATPGNHDLYALHGRHQSKRFLNADGTHMLATSDPEASIGDATSRLVTADMYCAGYAEGLAPLSAFGYFRNETYLHWESPFGPSDRLDDRTYRISSNDGGSVRTMIDASYLVEPVDGLWLLSLDANVFEPRDGDLDPALETSYFDSTDAGWNAMLKHKGFLLDWSRDVTRRAERLGKKLLVFSHYPVIDPLNGTLDDEVMLFGDTSFARRAPRPAVAEAVIAAGIKVHFSGHLHVNDTGCVANDRGFLVNIAVPSPVAFPSAYKLAEFVDGRLNIETIAVDGFTGFDAAFEHYRREALRGGVSVDFLDGAMSHGQFLDEHLVEMVRRRYLPLEWPRDLASIVPLLTLGDLMAIAATRAPLSADDVIAKGRTSAEGRGWRALPFLDLVVDWYRLRKARELAQPFIAPEKREAYRQLRAAFAAGAWSTSSLQTRLAAFMRMLGVYSAGEPSVDFSIDLASGAIIPLSAGHFGRTERRQIGSA